MHRILLLLLVLLPAICSANQIEDEIARKGLTKSDPPTGGITEEISHKLFYQVEKEDNNLQIRPLDWAASKDLNKRTLEIHGYKLIGIDKGEWGGKLVLHSQDKEPKILMDDNITSLHVFKDKIYVITGLAHGTYNNGAVYELQDIESNPKLKLITLLPSAPEYVISDDRSIYILTYSDLIALEHHYNSFTLEIIAHNAPWNGFAPRSLVKINKTFVIGMQAGIATITERGYGRYEIQYYGQ